MTTTTHLRVRGMHCASCVRRVEAALDRVEGLRSAQVNFGAELATVEHDTDLDRLVAAVKAAGYRAEPLDDPLSATAIARDREERARGALFLSSAVELVEPEPR